MTKPKPKATAMKVDTAPAVKTTGVGLASPATSSDVRITGSTGVCHPRCVRSHERDVGGHTGVCQGGR